MSKVQKLSAICAIAVIAIIACITLCSNKGDEVDIERAMEEYARSGGRGALSENDVSAMLKEDLGTSLPSSAKDVYGIKNTGYGSVARVRFTCKQKDLRKFIDKTPLTDAKWIEHAHPEVSQSMGREEWWQPRSIGEIRQASVQTPRGKDTISATLFTGDESIEPATVYMMIVIYDTAEQQAARSQAQANQAAKDAIARALAD